MPAVSHVDLTVAGTTLTTTADTQVGLSSSLANATTYLVVGAGNVASTGADGTNADATFLIGASDASRTVYARAASESDTFAPSAGLDTAASGGTKPLNFACLHTTTGASEELELQAWGGTAAGEASLVCSAIDLTLLPGPGSGIAQCRYHSETANSDTIVDTPTSGYEEVGTTLTFTPNRAGDFTLFISAELVNDGTAAATDEIDIRVTVDGAVLDGSEHQADIGDRADAVMSYGLLGRVVNLTAAEHDIAVEVNGTSSNGNIGVRRIRIHAIESAALPVLAATDAGETLTTTDASPLDQTIGGINFSIGNGSDDFLLFYSGQKQVNFWGEAHFLLGGSTETPTDGFGVGAGADFGTAATDDQPLEVGVGIASAPASSTSVQVRLTKVGFGASSNLYGNNTSRAANGNLYASALQLNFNLTVDISGTSSGTSTATATATPPGNMEGSAAGTSTATATLTGTGELGGQADGTGTASATLTGLGALVSVADALAQYDDDFIGNGFTAQWAEYLPAAVDREVVEGGEANIAPTQGGLAGSHWFDDRDGLLRYITTSISGGFDYRARFRVRNSAGDGSPSTAAGEFRFAGIAVHDPNRATERNYVHIMLGADPNGTNRVEWKTTDSSDSTFDSVAGSAPLDYDLRIVRVPDDIQVFRLYYRRTDDGETLDSDVGWTLLNTIDRDDNATPARTTATNMPAAVQLGWSGGYAGPQTDHDIQSWMDRVRVRTGTPETGSGRSTAVASPSVGTTGSADGTSTASATLVGTGAMSGQADGTSTASATPTVDGAMEGSSAGTSTASATPTGLGAMAATVAGIAASTALLIGTGALVGQADGSSTASATLVGSGSMAGQADGTSTATATASEPPGAMSGTATGTSTATGTLTGVGSMSGTAAGTSTAIAVAGGPEIGTLEVGVMEDTVFGVTVRDA